jgi:imidazole glycerol-phosphate synthase subunit HisH
MSTSVTVIDAGVGNLANLERALAAVGGDVEITSDPRRVAAARTLVLPGVGAFAPPRERLAESGCEEALREALDRGAWLLGVCVGYQLLFEASEEFGVTEGLGLLTGRVTALPSGVPLPHIGWNRLHDLKNGGESPLVTGLRGSEPYVYFVHTYAPEGVPEHQVLARATHGRSFPAIAGSGRVMGTQFHPEKSGAAGLLILKGFLETAS